MNKKFYLIFSNVFLVMNFAFLISTNTNAQTVKINVTPSPNLCIGDSMTLKRTISGFAPSTTTTYYKNDTLIFTGDIYGKGNLKLTDAAWYKVKVVDQTNQSRVDSIFISVNLLPKYDSITIDKIKTCGGQGSIIVWGLKDTTEYTLSFKYNNGADSFFNIKSDANGKLTKNMLLAGKYSNIQVKLNNCTSNVSPNTVDLVDPPLPITSLTIKQELCQGDTITFIGSPVNGTLKVISGDGTVTSSGTKLTTTPNGVTPIIIEYSFKDPTTKCTGISRDTIKINPLPIITADVDSVKCFGGNDGKIIISPGIYDYTWSTPPLTGSTPTNLSAATYAVTATDLKGCKYSLPSIVVCEPTALVATNVQDRVICFNSPETFPVNISGGTPYYAYSWMGPDDSGNTKDINYSKGGDYSITITDFNNCQLIEEITVIENPEIIITFSSVPTNFHFCEGEELTLTASGADTYIWEGSFENPIFKVDSTEAYTVKGIVTRNGKECNIEKNIMVTEDPLPSITFEDIITETKSKEFKICEGSKLSIEVSDGNLDYDYLWYDGSISEIKEFNLDTTYSITVTNNITGCLDTSIFKISYYDILKVKIKDASFVDYADSDTVCVNGDTYIFNLNGDNTTFSNSLIEWSSSNPDLVKITPSGNNRRADVIFGNGDFTLYVKTFDMKLGCESKDSIKFYILGPATNITEMNSCGLILIKNNYKLDPIPQDVDDLGNGFYFIKDSAKLSYIFKGECKDTMEMPVINPQRGFNYKMDTLIYDECGPFLLAKDQHGLCFDWYQINKEDKSHTLLTGKNDSWLKLIPPLDTVKNDYVAIGYDCNNNCDTTQISVRSDEGGKTIPCYNSGESAIKIYPNPNQGHMYLKLEGLPAGKQEIFIYDMMGRQVYKKTVDHTGNNDTTELSLTHLPDGIYFAKTYYNGTGISTKFIITH